MRRYCKNVDITDIDFIKRCIYLWIDGKKSRDDVRRFLAEYSNLSYREISGMLENGDQSFLAETIRRIADDTQSRIIARDLRLPEIRFKDKYDDVCRKWRRIGIQKPIHQIFDYIAVEGCMELFHAKIGHYQMASIKGRGQEKGVRAISKWMRTDPAHTRYFVKMDVKKCYNSVSHEVLKAMFTRDLKNKTLLWMVCELIDAFPDGLSIGSYFSQYACNYMLSKAYHYATERLNKIRKTKRGTETVRLVYHVLFYMDDIWMSGSSEKDVKRGAKMPGQFVSDELNLTIKPDWEVQKTDYIGKDGKHSGRFIDMMGYRIYRDHITIRRTTFRRARRAVLRAEKRINGGKEIPLWLAYRIASYHGRFLHSDSFQLRKSYRIDQIAARCGRVISSHDKQRQYELK